jgi:hypothetical protein
LATVRGEDFSGDVIEDSAELSEASEDFLEEGVESSVHSDDSDDFLEAEGEIASTRDTTTFLAVDFTEEVRFFFFFFFLVASTVGV